MGEAAVDEGKRVMASDDMSLFLRERPGCYFRVGIAPATGPARPHHAPEFEMNEVYKKHAGSEPPARSTVQVVALPAGALVEIEAVAHL